MTVFSVFVSAFTLAGVLLLVMLSLFPKLGLLDFPERYGLKRLPLPYPLGIVAPLVFLLFLFIVAQRHNMQFFALVSAIVVLGIVCFLDDRKPLPAMTRLALQILVAIALFVTGTRIATLTNPLDIFGFGNQLLLEQWMIPSPLGPLPILSGLFTVGWLLLTINALNWFDGIGGQVSVLSTIGFLTIGLLSVSERVGQVSLGMLALSLAGIALACAVATIPPARGILGDSGSMFFGLMLGVLTIYAGGKVATAFLVLGVPLIDLVIVVIRRIRKGASPFAGNARDEHLHHRLLNKGWSEAQVILLTAVLGTAFGVTALFLSTLGKVLAAAVLAAVMLALSWYSAPKKS
jgi:UDP-N-acetylmuramyl pentapeptide phosphotransferase/UDP-N-acetylglucosamine-1-phosphate transferase